MKISRVLIATIIIFVLHTVVGMLTCGKYFSWIYQIEPTNVWKAMTGSPSLLFFLSSLILCSFPFALFYGVLQKAIPGNNTIVKGLVYGLIITILGLIPGMISTYFFMTVAYQVIIYWTIWGLIMNSISGAIVAVIYGE